MRKHHLIFLAVVAVIGYYGYKNGWFTMLTNQVTGIISGTTQIVGSQAQYRNQFGPSSNPGAATFNQDPLYMEY